jgi:hypothetical protein
MVVSAPGNISIIKLIREDFECQKDNQRGAGYTSRQECPSDNRIVRLARFGLRILASTGSTPKLCAGGPSIMMLIHKICIALRGDGSPKAVATLAIARAANDVLNWKERKLRMLKNIPFPLR